MRRNASSSSPANSPTNNTLDHEAQHHRDIDRGNCQMKPKPDATTHWTQLQRIIGTPTAAIVSVLCYLIIAYSVHKYKISYCANSGVEGSMSMSSSTSSKMQQLPQPSSNNNKMNNKMKVHAFPQTLVSPSRQLHPLTSTLTVDWYNDPLKSPIQYAFAVDPIKFYFYVSRPNWPIDAAMKDAVHPTAKRGEFVKGLWEYEVAEFFLLDGTRTNSGLQKGPKPKYLEFNLAPNGAWWSSAFADVRQPINEDGIKLDHVVTEEGSLPDTSDGQYVYASIPLKVLKEYGWKNDDVGKGEVALEATFIVREKVEVGTKKSTRERFVSSSGPVVDGGEPNFHRPDVWKKVELFPVARYA